MSEADAVKMIPEILGPIITTGPRAFRNAALRGMPCRQINGRQLIGYVPVTDDEGNIVIDYSSGHGTLLTRRARFTLPKGHPWRARPRSEYREAT